MSHSQTAPSHVFSLQKAIRICAVALCAGGLLGLIGPFGTYEGMVPPIRFGYWVGVVLIGTLIHTPLYYAALLFGRHHKIPTWIWVTGSAFIAALPMTFVINGIAASMFGNVVMDSYARLYPLVPAISLPMQLLTYFTSDHNVPSRSETVTAVVDSLSAVPTGQTIADTLVSLKKPQPALFARLPARIGTMVMFLEMEDHYVRVHTALGETMIHMRMADAVRELDGIEGMLVHRSYWVAREAVKGWSRDGKTMTLSLSNGKSVPVARDRQPLVRAAGWLE